MLNASSADPCRPCAARCLLRLARHAATALVAPLAVNRATLFSAWWSLSYVAGYTLEAIAPQITTSLQSERGRPEPATILVSAAHHYGARQLHREM